MYGHAMAAGVQAQGCLALWGLAAASGEIRGAVAAAGGIEAVVSAMTAHREDAAVQEQGAGALQSLAADALGRARAVGAGGVEAIVDAIRAHRTQPAVQEFGCWALANLASGPGCALPPACAPLAPDLAGSCSLGSVC